MLAEHGSTTLLLALAAAILAIARSSTSGDPATLAALLAALRSTAGERGLAVVAAWIAGMGVPRNDRADVTQRALETAAAAWPRFNPDFNRPGQESSAATSERRRKLFSRWLHRIVARSVSRYFRQHFRSVEILMEEPLDPETPDPRRNAEAELLAEQSRLHLLDALLRADPEAAGILVARNLDERPMREIVEMAGIPLSTAYKMRARARAALRAELERLKELGCTLDDKED
ncbi:sigma-70 family RNA polymerase sigma factor [Sorangium cellulosum]|uniref:sigma-70 family RNA polymerase sigma factor n=1 Tax=Sorangium cellulosum TaxID=56 RepID=UPI0003F69DDB|nr:sigma-70 family RNA polymerase sigma factor [Sorangium cellulosum]